MGALFVNNGRTLYSSTLRTCFFVTDREYGSKQRASYFLLLLYILYRTNIQLVA
jgi:hypothetical protein